MSTFFLKRGYPKTVIDRALDSVSRKNRTQVLTPKRQSNSDRVPLVLTYHPHNIAIRNILFRNFKTIVLKDPLMANIFPSLPLTAFRRGKCLREHLVSSTYTSKPISTDYRGTKRCNRPRCVTCPYTFETDEIQGPDNSFAIQGGFTCITENLVYAVVCNLCHKIYIGETYRCLGDRFREHLGSVRNDLDCPVGNHFRLPGHDMKNMKVTVVIKVESGQENRRLLEQRIVYHLGTLRPRGLNVKRAYYQ